MQQAHFSTDIPALIFRLMDRGDYYELLLRFKINGKVMRIHERRNATFFICAAVNPHLWYLLESEMDVALVEFFNRKDFALQIPKAYYESAFVPYVREIQKHYRLTIK